MAFVQECINFKTKKNPLILNGDKTFDSLEGLFSFSNNFILLEFS